MPSLRSINKEAGTTFRRWKEVPQALIDLKVAQPVPEPKPDAECLLSPSLMTSRPVPTSPRH